MSRLNDFMTCSAHFNIWSEGPYLSFGTLLEDKIYYICSSDTYVHKA